MTPAELRALADDVEKLDGPDKGVDWRIARAVECYYPRLPPPRFTGSIDAAASLMPPRSIIEVYDARIRDEKWLVIAKLGPRPDDTSWCHAAAATEPLARTACALRARAALLEAGATDAAGPEAA